MPRGAHCGPRDSVSHLPAGQPKGGCRTYIGWVGNVRQDHAIRFDKALFEALARGLTIGASFDYAKAVAAAAEVVSDGGTFYSVQGMDVPMPVVLGDKNWRWKDLP